MVQKDDVEPNVCTSSEYPKVSENNSQDGKKLVKRSFIHPNVTSTLLEAGTSYPTPKGQLSTPREKCLEPHQGAEHAEEREGEQALEQHDHHDLRPRPASADADGNTFPEQCYSIRTQDALWQTSAAFYTSLLRSGA